MKKNTRTFKIETAEIGRMRLVQAKPCPPLPSPRREARAVILKLIRALRNL
jgi:hypothetical protein